MLFTRTNALMDQCLAQLDSQQLQPVSIDMVHFAKYMLSDFICYQDCVLLAANISNHCQHLIAEQNQLFTDKLSAYAHCTALECGENHVHLTDFLTDHNVIEWQSLELLYMGMAYLELLRMQLRSRFPNEAFRLIITYKLAKIDPDDDVTHDCIVRFHKIRAGEVWYAPSSEAVAELDIS